MKRAALIFFLLIFAATNLLSQQSDFPKLINPYLGQTSSEITFEIFLSGFLSSEVHEFSYSGHEYVQDTLVINAKIKEEVVMKVAAIMQEKYVFADIGEKMAKHIKQKHKKGEYNSFSEVKPFCRKLTSDLREVSNDKHIFVFYSPEEAREVAARNNLLPAEEIRKINEYYEKMDRRENYGFGKIEILDGNIGYVDLNWFSDSPGACEKVIGLMSYLSNTDAIIIDLRDNGGGGGSAGHLFKSYFFGEEKVPFTGVYYRETNETEQSWSATYVPGKRLPDVDLYILTSSRTFSAAEDFCYSLQALKRAVIIGEKTKGGAHPVDVIIVKGDILTQVSIGNSINSVTGTNWEVGGVKPDVEVVKEKAMDAAYLLALKNLEKKTTEQDWKEKLSSLINDIEMRKEK